MLIWVGSVFSPGLSLFFPCLIPGIPIPRSVAAGSCGLELAWVCYEKPLGRVTPVWALMVFESRDPAVSPRVALALTREGIPRTSHKLSSPSSSYIHETSSRLRNEEHR